MQQFTPAEWQSWERFYRVNFINSLTGFKSASLIGTINAQGVPNLGMFSSIVHIGSDPALIGYINRPLAAAPHTLANIKANGFVKESPIKYLLSLKEIVPITLNATFLVIGQLEQVLMDPSLKPTTDGFLHLDQAGSICSNGLDAYYHTTLIDRYAYAKPDKAAEKL
jgi:flavin reductase (DIM6/NTAB) family NADH-FMN oxidoreductase RutF